MPLLRVAGLLLAAAVLSACGESDPSTIETPSPSASPTASASASPSVVPTASPTSTLPAGVDQLVRVTVRADTVVGGAQRITVKTGDVVRLVVTSDVADEVHLHTYDKTVDVTAGGTATLTFTASIPGVIEAELEDAGLTLVRFQIQ